MQGITKTVQKFSFLRAMEKNPRRLTPEECRALMGYPDNFKIRDIGVSDTQLYRQFGNSVVVPVVLAIAKKMIVSIDKNSTV